jgi:hypothetical protein
MKPRTVSAVWSLVSSTAMALVMKSMVGSVSGVRYWTTLMVSAVSPRAGYPPE